MIAYDLNTFSFYVRRMRMQTSIFAFPSACLSVCLYIPSKGTNILNKFENQNQISRCLQYIKPVFSI